VSKHCSGHIGQCRKFTFPASMRISPPWLEAWVFTRSGGGWRQQGGKLVGTTNEYGGGSASCGYRPREQWMCRSDRQLIFS
jgi:hypothetical protein